MKLPSFVKPDRGGFRGYVRVRPFPARTKRWPAGTPVATMELWHATQLAALRGARATHTERQRTADHQLAPATLMSTAVERHIAAMRPDMHRETAASWRRWLRLAAAAFPNRTPESITAAEWTEMLRAWERDGLPGSTYRGRPGALTLNNIRICFVAFYRTLDPDGVNPARKIPRRTAPALVPRGIPMADAWRIVAAVPWAPMRARLTLMLVLGLRPVEVAGIDPWRQWDRRRGTLYIGGLKKGRGTRGRMLGPLPALAIEALTTLERLGKFGAFTSTALNQAFKLGLDAAGLRAQYPALRPYDLRHTFGTHVYVSTRDIKATQEAMGHSPGSAVTHTYVMAAVSTAVASALASVETATTPPPPPAASARRLRRVK